MGIDENRFPYSAMRHTTAYTAQSAPPQYKSLKENLARLWGSLGGKEGLLAAVSVNLILHARCMRDRRAPIED